MAEKNSPLVKVDLAQEQSHQQVLGMSLENTFKRAASKQFVIEHHHHPAHEIQNCSVVQACVVLNLGGTYIADQWIDGRFYHNQFERGDCIVFPAEITHRVIWDRPIQFLMIGFDALLIQNTALELKDTEEWKTSANHMPEIISRDRLNDPLIYQIGLALKTEFQINRSINLLYAESMINLLLIHLLRRYSSNSYSPPKLTNGLPTLKLKQVLEYIHENITQNVGLTELATVAQMSPHHFANLFRQSTGFPPHQYIIHRRLDKARELLRSTNLPITDIAEQAGFSSQSHLTTLFRKYLSVTPKTYRDML